MATDMAIHRVIQRVRPDADPVKRKAPSRVRYEAANPTVSCRVPKEVYDRLQRVRETEDRSFADVLKIGLGILEVRAKVEGEIRKQSHGEGYKRGFAEAERLHKVVYPCNVCRKPMAVTSDQERQGISQYMQQEGWGHKECHDKRR